MIIIPISKLRSNLSKVIQQVKKTDGFAVILQHGNPSAVLFSYELFEHYAIAIEDIQRSELPITLLPKKAVR